MPGARYWRPTAASDSTARWGLRSVMPRMDFPSLRALPGPGRWHLALKTARLADAGRVVLIADRAAMGVAPGALREEDCSATLARRVDRSRRGRPPGAPFPSSDTVFLTVVDRGRMAVSLI